MGLSHSPSLVMNGLTLCLDAANTKSILSAVEVLVVAGGGAGGQDFAGGGGAGGLIYSSSYSITPGSAITVTIGAGGLRPTTVGQVRSGSPSVFGSLTAIGGGAGTGSAVGASVGPNGGSGGGGGAGYSAGTGTSGQGFGGASTASGVGGGGGGAGGPGLVSGIGGPGLQYSISGTPTYYAGGGGGGGDSGFPYAGGIGGGGTGTGVYQASTSNGVDGTGGGGAGYYGGWGGAGNGGSGIVIVRYPGSQRASGGTVTFVAGHTIHTFTTSGTFTPNFGDLSNNGNTGTLTNGPTYSSANGGSLVFDGVDDYVDCVLNSGLTGTGSWTMSAWFKINGAPSAGLYQNAIVDTDATGGSANMICTDWSGYHGGSQNQLLYASRPSTGGSYTNLLGPVLTQGIWYNATVVRNGTTDTKLYTNGSLSATYTGNISTATQPLVRIGRWTDAANYANCNISQVQIHNRALTAAEVSQNFNALKSRYI